MKARETYEFTAQDFERLMARVEPDTNGGCWLWVGTIKPFGYGKIGIGCGKNQRTLYVHRAVYEHLVGPVPDGLDLDHLCRVRCCCNPDHLEPVTRQENLLRGQTLAAANADATECPQGHPYDEANTYWRPDGIGRDCVACRAEASVRAAEKSKAARHARGLKPKRNQWTGPWVAEPV